VPTVILTVVDATAEAARWAMTQYVTELARRFSEGFDTTGVLDDAAVEFNPPHGLFVLGTTGDGATLGCVALNFIDERTAEAKRMWVSPGARGTGIGTRLLAKVEDEARRTGRTVLLLDTNRALSEAVTLYTRRGFEAIPRYNDNPYAHHWFEKLLEASPSTAS
jgi:GNAT superfamily N-acetyltransferase